MNRSSEDIEREVEAAREDLDSTVEALKSKMSPGQLLDEVTRSLKGTGAENMVHNLGAQVRENPLAIAMIGAGMAWLMMGKGSSSHAHDGQMSGSTGVTPDLSGYPLDERLADGGGPASTQADGGGLMDKAHHLADGARHAAARAGEAAGHAREGVMGAAGAVKHGAQHLGSGAAHAGQRIQRTFMDTLEQEPLIIGALGLAVGAALGASLPSTRFEDRTLGKARDKVMEKGREAAEQGLSMAKDAAEAAYQGVTEEAQSQGLIGGQDGALAEKAESVIRAGVEAAREKIDEGRAH